MHKYIHACIIIMNYKIIIIFLFNIYSSLSPPCSSSSGCCSGATGSGAAADAVTGAGKELTEIDFNFVRLPLPFAWSVGNSKGAGVDAGCEGVSSSPGLTLSLRTEIPFCLGFLRFLVEGGGATAANPGSNADPVPSSTDSLTMGRGASLALGGSLGFLVSAAAPGADAFTATSFSILSDERGITCFLDFAAVSFFCENSCSSTGNS